MGLTINTNIASLNAQRNLNKSKSPLETAMQRLSSGLKINSAKEKGYSISYLSEALGVIYKETFDLPNDLPNDLPQNLDDEWKKRIRFFAKWCGRLPKDDNYIKFAGELLKV